MPRYHEENRRMRQALKDAKDAWVEGRSDQLFWILESALRGLPDHRSWRDRLAAWWTTRRASGRNADQA